MRMEEENGKELERRDEEKKKERKRMWEKNEYNGK